MTLAEGLWLAFMGIAVAGLLWTVANVYACLAWFRLRIVFRRAPRPSNVLQFPIERNRAS